MNLGEELAKNREITLTFFIDEHTYSRLDALAKRWNEVMNEIQDEQSTPETVLASIVKSKYALGIGRWITELENFFTIKKSADCAAIQTTQGREKHSTHNIQGGGENVKTL